MGDNGSTMVSAGGVVASPAHLVTIKKGFYLGKHELTQAQWKAALDTAPWQDFSEVWGLNQLSAKEGDDYPVSAVTWKESTQFAARLNQLRITGATGKFRLPT